MRQHGTFRDVIGRLPHIIDRLGFGILQLLPIHPVPTTYARMGELGSPYAALDFFSVDPAFAQFDTAATPMDQFRELLDAVHAKGARLFIDLPANHTGWASTLQTRHPEWFKRNPDGSFKSPGAWGVVWEDLVELDYSHLALREYMADVFLYWCRLGVDGFRCDAGYMIPSDAWGYIVARVRTQFPDTVFFLEGLGGAMETTCKLLTASNLDWAYSELFQTYARADFEHYLPEAWRLSRDIGPLVHFAETHDNLRLAATSPVYATMRVALSALLSDGGAWGIANGVEWLATERINVHGNAPLNWDAKDNLCDDIATLNRLLVTHPAFGADADLRMIQTGDANTLAVLRTANTSTTANVLILVNLDTESPQTVEWSVVSGQWSVLYDTHRLSNDERRMTKDDNIARLAPGQVICLGTPATRITNDERRMTHDDTPAILHSSLFILHFNYPADLSRIVPVPPDHALHITCPHPFAA
ncbi:MAG: alpha-amylase family glycosyl hydrolase, partial [Kiritimatiellaeota bacterium]|nr:alpha-amylase family glycosyl hydrolase [Kiritimatiellota bacterium]